MTEGRCSNVSPFLNLFNMKEQKILTRNGIIILLAMTAAVLLLSSCRTSFTPQQAANRSMRCGQSIR
jgi:hypothetical protein